MFQEYASEGISHPVFYDDLIYKLKRIKSASDLVSLNSKKVKSTWRRKYDIVITERTICLVLDPSIALYRFSLKHCTLTFKAVENIWRDLSKSPQRIQGPDTHSHWLQSDSFCSRMWARLQSIVYFGECLYIFLIFYFYHLKCLCNNFYCLSARFAIGSRFLWGGLFTNICVFFWLHSFTS